MRTDYTLLIVDDEPNVLKSLVRLLIDTNYKVVTCESAEQGLEKLEEEDVHLVISDYRMPGMNGVEFLSRVKEKYPDTIRLILSGFADASAVVGAINDGQVYKFIPKRWNDQDLLTTIMRAFERYNLEKENQNLYSVLQERNDELQKLTKSLEEKVTERTVDLKLKNQALEVAQKILNMLPVGVIGIDSEGTVVYTNAALRQQIGNNSLKLGCSASGALDDSVLEGMMKSISSQQTEHVLFDSSRLKYMICKPLADGSGTIGTVFQIENDICQRIKDVSSGKAGALNA